MNDEKRTELVSFRLTPSEKDKLDNLVSEYQVKNVSDFIRQIILTGKFKTTKQAQNDERLLYEINKIGINLNQIARLCNTRGSVDAKILKVLAKIEEKLDLLIEIKEF
jgi:Arc/MetJ-type ribon-helix-helix transcriptional regulator